MKTETTIKGENCVSETGLAIYYSYYNTIKNTDYRITELYYASKDVCMVKIEDRVNQGSHYLHLKAEWVTAPHNLQSYFGSNGYGLILTKEIVEMIDINAFGKGI